MCFVFNLFFLYLYGSVFPISLYTVPQVPGLVQHQHPAQHRYPVWWTGDGVVLVRSSRLTYTYLTQFNRLIPLDFPLFSSQQASVQSMVDSGVHDFKPYVHSDCGGT